MARRPGPRGRAGPGTTTVSADNRGPFPGGKRMRRIGISVVSSGLLLVMTTALNAPASGDGTGPAPVGAGGMTRSSPPTSTRPATAWRTGPGSRRPRDRSRWR